MRVHAVLPAAGVGRRFGSDIPKQYQALAGKTILEHSIAQLHECQDIGDIWVAIGEQDSYWEQLDQELHQSVNVVLGGAERADSVRLAIAAITDAQSEDWVLVHDAVRPLVSPRLISALLGSLSKDEPGAILAMPIYDTVKQTNADGLVETTLDRSCLWTAQTPQVFRYDLLKDALDAAAGDPAITDEASAMEFAGHAVRLYQGHRNNIKITRPEDLALAELLIKASGNDLG